MTKSRMQIAHSSITQPTNGQYGPIIEDGNDDHIGEVLMDLTILSLFLFHPYDLIVCVIKFDDN